MKSAEKSQKLQSELNHKGFTFECYSRDPMIADERRQTTSFLKEVQIPLEHQKKVEEEQFLREAPANLLTTDKLEQLREQARRQALEERNMLKDQFGSQYYNHIQSK